MAEGMRARLTRIPGETPKGLLHRPLILPAVLGAVGWTEEALHTEYDTISGGQFSQPGMGPGSARRLKVLDDLGTLTMTWDPPWLVKRGLDPSDVKDALVGVLRSRRPVELLLSRLAGHRGTLFRGDVTMRSLAHQVREGEPDTIYYTVHISEWRPAHGKRRGQGRGDHLPTTHKLTATDSLHSLALRYYHSALAGDLIASANSIRGWGKKTPLVKMHRFKVGSKIRIPKPATAHIETRGVR